MSLLMPSIRANDTNMAMTTNNLAISADTLHRRTHFHDPDTPRRRDSSAGLAAPSDGFQVAFLQQAFVLVRHHMGLYLRHEIHRDYDDNQQ